MTVKVSSVLYNEIMAIKESGEVDINDPDAVLEYAKKHGYSVITRMITGNPNRYSTCIREGMEQSD